MGAKPLSNNNRYKFEGVEPLSNNNTCGSEGATPLLKNGFVIFAWAVAVGSKGCLVMTGAVWDVAALTSNLLINVEKKCRKFRTSEVDYSPDAAQAGHLWYF